MNSTQLIGIYKSCKEALGEKATDWNMFLEGYGSGISDIDVRNTIVKETIDKACEWLRNNMDNHNDNWYSIEEFIEKFRKAMEG